MARNSRFRKFSKNCSELHERVREVLSDMFPTSERYEEYPLDKILEKGYKDQRVPKEHQDNFLLNRGRKLRCDFCLLKLSTVIEVQGEHHYKIIDYDKKDLDKGIQNFEHRKHLDRVKRLIYKEAGFNLVEIPYTEIRNKSSEEIEKFLMKRM